MRRSHPRKEQSMKPKDASLAAFFKSVKKSYHSSRGGTMSAEKQNVIQSPSLPVFRLHHQERKQECKSN